MVNQLEVSYENSGFTHEISTVIIQLIIDILISLDWFKGKSTGNHGFYHSIWGFLVKFPVNQSNDNTGWWFGTIEFYDFPKRVGNVTIPTDELIFFRRVETTNQNIIMVKNGDYS